MTGPSAQATVSRARTPNPLVMFDLALSVDLWAEHSGGIITAISVAAPGRERRWDSRSSQDKGTEYDVAAYVEFETCPFDAGWIVVGRGGWWKPRLARFDGYVVDVARLIPLARRQKVGELSTDRPGRSCSACAGSGGR